MNKLVLGLGFLILPTLVINPRVITKEQLKSDYCICKEDKDNLEARVSLDDYMDTLDFYAESVKKNVIEYRNTKKESLEQIEELESKSKQLEVLNKEIKENLTVIDQELTELMANKYVKGIKK